jgi:hypothetical protein
MDYPPDRLIISVLDDGYFERTDHPISGPHFTRTFGGLALEEMIKST